MRHFSWPRHTSPNSLSMVFRRTWHWKAWCLAAVGRRANLTAALGDTAESCRTRLHRQNTSVRQRATDLLGRDGVRQLRDVRQAAGRLDLVLEDDVHGAAALARRQRLRRQLPVPHELHEPARGSTHGASESCCNVFIRKTRHSRQHACGVIRLRHGRRQATAPLVAFKTQPRSTHGTLRACCQAAERRTCSLRRAAGTRSQRRRRRRVGPRTPPARYRAAASRTAGTCRPPPPASTLSPATDDGEHDKCQ